MSVRMIRTQRPLGNLQRQPNQGEHAANTRRCLTHSRRYTRCHRSTSGGGRHPQVRARHPWPTTPISQTPRLHHKSHPTFRQRHTKPTGQRWRRGPTMRLRGSVSEFHSSPPVKPSDLQDFRDMGHGLNLVETEPMSLELLRPPVIGCLQRVSVRLHNKEIVAIRKAQRIASEQKRKPAAHQKCSISAVQTRQHSPEGPRQYRW